MAVLSVLLPFRDAAATIREALASVLCEREVPLEVIAVDDGSEDEGARVVEGFGDARVRLLRTEGIGVARATALAANAARFSLLARMDADDVSLPGRFAAQVAALRDERLSVVGTLVEAFGEVGEGARLYVEWLNGIVTPEDHAREIFVESPLCQPSVAIRRAALEAVGGYRESVGPEDYDLWLRLHAAGHRLAKVPQPYLRWRHHARRATHVDPRCALPQFALQKAPFLAARLRDSGRDVVVWGAGKTGRRLARALEAHGVFPSAFVDIDPRKIGGVARGVPIIDPAMLDARAVVVVAVGARGARAIVRGRLRARELVEGVDFVCAS